MLTSLTGNEWAHEMHLQVWVPWLLAAGNITSLVLTGQRKRSGFTVLIVTQALFIAYAVLTGQTGFLLQNVVMVGVAAVHWHRWGRDSGLTSRNPVAQ